MEITDQGEDGLCGLGVKSGGGFVAEEDLRAGGKSTGDGDPLLLSAGKLSGVGFQLVAQAHQF